MLDVDASSHDQHKVTQLLDNLQRSGGSSAIRHFSAAHHDNTRKPAKSACIISPSPKFCPYFKGFIGALDGE